MEIPLAGSTGDILGLKRHAAGTDDKNRQVSAVVRSGNRVGWGLRIEPAGDGGHGDLTGTTCLMRGGETRGGSSPPFGTMLIIKGISVFHRSPFFRNNMPTGLFFSLF